MNKHAASVVVGLWIVCLGVATAATAVAQEVKKGAVKGKITVRGVRSPEHVLVYLEEVPGEHAPPEKPAEMDQVKLAFVPHVLPIVRGTTVRFKNSDPFLHNVNWPASKNGAYPANNLGTWGRGSTRDFTFKKEGHLVVLCNVHPEEEAHLVVLQNPFFAVVGKEGTYEISDVPAGRYTIKTWYPNARKLKSQSADVTVEGGKATELDFSLSRR